MKIFNEDEAINELDQELIQSLIQMLNENNALDKMF